MQPAVEQQGGVNPMYPHHSKRQMCMKCRTQGHLSSACPTTAGVTAAWLLPLGMVLLTLLLLLLLQAIPTILFALLLVPLLLLLLGLG
jgi:hypothetical protein